MANINKKIKQLRKDILTASYKAGACHISSALSCLNILVEIFYDPRVLNKGDIFLFAKASGVAAFYAILADKKMFPKNKLAYYLKNYPLASTEVPGVVHSVGSLGHGLPVAVGMALADRSRKVICLISDGECQEGTTYECALFARQHNLFNLYVLVDNNGLQACGETRSILDLNTAFDFLQKTFPNFVNYRTIKGRGVPFMEDRYQWHYKNLDKELLDKALKWI